MSSPRLPNLHLLWLSIGLLGAGLLWASPDKATIVNGEELANPPAVIDLNPADLRARLADDFRKYETKHFIVFSDAPGSNVRALTGTLERTYYQFERSARRLKLQPKPLTRKYSCVLFNERRAFQQFAEKWDEISAEWMGGYFANAGNYMVFYVAEDNPGMADAEKKFAEWEQEHAELKRRIRTARAERKNAQAEQLQQYANQLADHLKSERERLSEFTNAEARSRTIHETVHLLAFNTGIQIRERLAPFWLSEGLATNFESTSARGAFGPDYENERRRNAFENLLRAEQLLTLRSLVGITEVKSVSSRRAETLYQQTYALFRWLYRFRRDELSAFFKLYALDAKEKNALPFGTLTSEKHREAFERIFGDIEKLEKRWLRWEHTQLK